MKNKSTPAKLKISAPIFLTILTLGFTSLMTPDYAEAAKSKSYRSSYKYKSSKRKQARNKRHQKSDNSCFVATNYFLPEDKKFSCDPKSMVSVQLGNSTAKICPEAKVQARRQGSIQVKHGDETYLYRYNGSSEKKPENCSTTTGAAGVCLIPYVHIAADPAFNDMGDIIDVPSLKGVEVPHPSGIGTMKHPGYFIVADTGGKIKGRNRFDFFIGKKQWTSAENPFGPKGLQMTDDRKCIRSYSKIKNNTQIARNIRDQIYAKVESPPMRTYASLPAPSPLPSLAGGTN